MMEFSPQHLLLWSLALPLIGAGLICLLNDGRPQRARTIALVTTLLTLLVAGRVAFMFPANGINLESTGGAFALTDASWLGKISGLDVRFSVGLDGLSVWFYALSALLSFCCVLLSWESIHERPATFYSLLLMLLCGMMGVFAARDILLFYVFFEFTLIPLYFLIGIWGHEDRNYAATKFFLFTLTGSVLTFLGLLTVVLVNFSHTGDLTFSIPKLTAALGPVGGHPMPLHLQLWIFAALTAGFAIKVPLFPLHTWLPLAHTQAPAAGSVLLAGVLLKLGTYGFARFNLPLAPEATAWLLPALLWISVAGIIYGALVALAQTDMKRLIAYSSVSHLGFCMLGLFALTPLAVQGGMLQAVNHGLSTGGLFAIMGMIHDRYHTREISALGGLARRTPWMALFMVFFTFSSIGLPGLNGFAGEFLLLAGMFQRAWMTTGPGGLGLKVIAVLAVSGVVLGAWYMLWLVQRVFFGPLREPHGTGHGHGSHDELGHDLKQPDRPLVRDLSLREIGALVPLAVFIFWIGLCPQFFLSRMAPALQEATQPAAAAWQARQTNEAADRQTALNPRPSVPVVAETSP
ncbi:MAG: NADH-quinone oxidoreductase subunit M [Planctomycetia bacterium]|nr:NADH-quinone oxidoreductase subunit M [Planctomycetia bacterium]